MPPLPVTHMPLLDEKQINELITAGMSLPLASSSYTVMSGKAGEMISTQQGSGMDFDDLRHFQVGDDHKHIDWRASARSQKTLLRSYFGEYDQPVFFVIDRLASMRFGSRKRLKVAQAVRLSLWLSGIYLQSGHDIGGMLLGQFDRRQNKWFDQLSGYDSLRYFALEASKACPPVERVIVEPDPVEPYTVQWKQIFAILKQQLPMGSTLYLLSDFGSLHADDVNTLRVIGKNFDTKAIRIYDTLEKQVEQLQGMELVWDKQTFRLNETENLQLLEQQIIEHEFFLTEEFNKAGITYNELSTSVDDFTQLHLELIK